MVVLQQRNISERIQTLSTLGRIDYSDVATITTDVSATPEEWARAIVEHAAGQFGQIFWRAIGIRLKPASEGHIGGWRIAAVDDDSIVLETAAFYAAINAVLEVGPDRVSLALLARYDHAFANLALPPVTLVHRRGIPKLLHAAVRHLGRRR